MMHVRAKRGVGDGALLALAASAVLHATPARGQLAQERAHARMVYEARAPECPTAAEFQSLVIGKLGYDPFADDAAALVGIRLAPKVGSPVGVTGSIVLRDGASKERRRRLEAETCASLASTMATTLALALDPIAASSPAAPEAPPEAAPPPAAPPPASDEGWRTYPDGWEERVAETQTKAPAATRKAAAVSAHGALGGGDVPGLGAGAGVTLLLLRAGWSLGLDGRFATTPSSFVVKSGDRLDVSIGSVGPVACVDTNWTSLCGAARVGELRARSSSVLAPANVRGMFGEVAIALRPKLALSDTLEVFLLLEGAVPISAVETRISNQTVWSTSAVTGRGGAGISFHLF